VLDDAATLRYARQIVVPGIGGTGQEKLLATTVLVIGDPRGAETAALYLAAAGMRVVREAAEAGSCAVVVVADAGGSGEELRAWLAGCAAPQCWYSVERDGFTSGVTPAAPLPLRQPARAAGIDDALHDAAACEAAALACAVVLGLAVRPAPKRESR